MAERTPRELAAFLTDAEWEEALAEAADRLELQEPGRWSPEQLHGLAVADVMMQISDGSGIPMFIHQPEL